MAEISGSELVARSLKNEGAEAFFYIMGGPMGEVEALSIKSGIRGVDVRHEQAAAMMAHAYSRLLQKPGVCMACSGPGSINLTTGLANALVDCAPVVALGGSAQIAQAGRGVFQEYDQLSLMKQCTKWAERVLDPKRIPELVNTAFQKAMSGKPGPVYLDLPRDVLYAKVESDDVRWTLSGRPLARSRPAGNPADIDALAEAVLAAERPIVVSGSGVIWSRASGELRSVVETMGIPFWTTPQGRGVVPDDHELSFPAMRSTAFREADLVLIVGTRMNYVIGHGSPPRFSSTATIARIDIDPDEIAATPRKVDIPVLGDCKTVLGQLLERLEGKSDPRRTAAWTKKLADGEAAKRKGPSPYEQYNEEPIHPLRLCHEIKDFIRRDAIVVVDGREILNYGRVSIPTFEPGHRLNSGPFGIMGVGVPFGVGAKVAKPDAQVVVLHGDGAFGLNGMEIDTAVRHNIPILIVISLNGGWTADPAGKKAGRDLGYTRYDKMAEALGCHGEYVERPEDIRGALERAQKKVDAGSVAVVNVKTDFRAGSSTPSSIDYDT